MQRSNVVAPLGRSQATDSFHCALCGCWCEQLAVDLHRFGVAVQVRHQLGTTNAFLHLILDECLELLGFCQRLLMLSLGPLSLDPGIAGSQFLAASFCDLEVFLDKL